MILIKRPAPRDSLGAKSLASPPVAHRSSFALDFLLVVQLTHTFSGSSDMSSPRAPQSPPNTAILARLVDSHAHPSDDESLNRAAEGLQRSKLKHVVRFGLVLLRYTEILTRFARQCAMSSSWENQNLTSALWQSDKVKVIPCFGE